MADAVLNGHADAPPGQLAEAGMRGDRRERARILGRLADPSSDSAAIMLLDQLARTEIAVAGPREHAAPLPRMIP